jgi:hypothetical protein
MGKREEERDLLSSLLSDSRAATARPVQAVVTDAWVGSSRDFQSKSHQVKSSHRKIPWSHRGSWSSLWVWSLL